MGLIFGRLPNCSQPSVFTPILHAACLREIQSTNFFLSWNGAKTKALNVMHWIVEVNNNRCNARQCEKCEYFPFFVSLRFWVKDRFQRPFEQYPKSDRSVLLDEPQLQLVVHLGRLRVSCVTSSLHDPAFLLISLFPLDRKTGRRNRYNFGWIIWSS